MEFWHNPRCSKSREALGLLADAGVAPDVRRYLDDPPSVDELRRVCDLLGVAPWELARLQEPEARELAMADWGREDPERWLEAMAAHPKLIERPVVVHGDRAVVGRPPTNVQALLD